MERHSFRVYHFVMPAAPSETDFLVVGAGIAGLRAAIELAPAGRVMVLVKREITDSSTQYAQGGIAAALSLVEHFAGSDPICVVLGDFPCPQEGCPILARPLPRSQGRREACQVTLSS